jgi:hypothetical protein
MGPLSHIKLVAVNIDGVSLPDLFSPVIRQVVEGWGFAYTPEVENAVFSKRRRTAAEFLKDYCKLALTPEQILDEFFKQRAVYEAAHPATPNPELEPFLKRLLEMGGVRVICYGGLGKDYFDKYLGGAVSALFAEYVCTDEVRPGVKEIIAQFGLRASEALFIDDVSGVGLAARQEGAAFIGHPSSESFQRAAMEALQCAYIVTGLREITDGMLAELDSRSANGMLWPKPLS